MATESKDIPYLLSDKAPWDVRFMNKHPKTGATLAMLAALACIGGAALLFYNAQEYTDKYWRTDREWELNPDSGLTPSLNYLGASDPATATFLMFMGFACALSARAQYLLYKEQYKYGTLVEGGILEREQHVHRAVGFNATFLLFLGMIAFGGLVIGAACLDSGHDGDTLAIGFAQDSSDWIKGTYMGFYSFLFLISAIGGYKQGVATYFAAMNRKFASLEDMSVAVAEESERRQTPQYDATTATQPGNIIAHSASAVLQPGPTS